LGSKLLQHKRNVSKEIAAELALPKEYFPDEKIAIVLVNGEYPKCTAKDYFETEGCDHSLPGSSDDLELITTFLESCDFRVTVIKNKSRIDAKNLIQKV